MPALQSSSRGHRSRRALADINVVPYIDVMLVLLIIFMVTAPLITPTMVKLPTVGNAPQAPSVLVQVTIQKDDMLEVSLRDPKSKAANAAPQPVSLKDLPQTVQQLAAQAGLSLDAMPVLIAADKNVKYNAVMRALNLLKQHGVERVGLAVQSNPS
ncbi:putative Biopolymer transport protein ExbD/TolR [Thiomonas arsenitoxydans]|uniref:Biopolymer transport protein ExbD/TolR n=1 Tax=Thiomonas arsenitoxydans (strain DSM 22701 / CIP 110005 / 3As) TaxID=426114 RepID=D6CLK9_THIA3|nr:biopolymer transporter ExbD [Thiomonas arsenitoxydans]CQR43748.1 putative Biopolymer transport protein ExbD/TolR [Thiomonas sp. CB3]CAZ89437.1 putative Biopolymer transport protein ExbD/TolR [Thiomonas arsenitoxydans]CQR33487.1 putative Biopolymer transport protein ExbD/TolR [Thiomonas arsenitoxydans]CQR35838.1 putative Biopolymer transport protein ExbD/TolR [Thiomonas arsenitoxydans]CQR38105.1 putative Biopolymer transport protein ExbD/TolR [Thiomonas arsenitoxydans]